MSDCVWFSQLELHDSLFRNYRSADPDGPSASERVAASLNLQGDVVPERFIPKSIRAQESRARKLGEINILVNGFLVVGAKVATALEQFDIGQGALHPLDVLDHKGKVTSKGEFFFWNIGNKLTHFRPDESQDVRKSNYGDEKPGEHIYTAHINPKHDKLAFSRDCMNGPDVWREKYLMDATLLSDQLVQSLRDLGLEHHFRLIRCRVV